ncbi:amidohydrolase family protein [Sphaerisporangium sp. TRM90804]|uniref:amidohydrolase family protein n=1 Tax=Sphaerisporangium sp. TRM90804 TaxID=3031113 RepID=UPI00244AED04|nr:amidohydrolase family protein [Sphaerisporangium sp. TRM90804]MDH2427539.1 amidohydrolase family protein [Sphaerisporangium sp. TRM90804]
MSIDVHQHIWTREFVEALRRRAAPPYLDGWTLFLDGEEPYEVNPADHDLDRRLKLNRGFDLALVSLSSPLGIEHLPAGEAWPLLTAYHEGALGLPSAFGAWASTCVTEIDPGRTAAVLDRGFAGLQLPATALLDADGLTRAAALLDLLEERGLPLFVHPGPASAPGTPGWWPAVVPYVQQMHAAWYAFHAFGRPRHPRLRVCFALLAGLAPLHVERFIARGGTTRGVVDPDVFLETSSYGHQAIDAVTRVLGVEVVVLGSDRPYASPAETLLGEAAEHQMSVTNPARLLERERSRAR